MAIKAAIIIRGTAEALLKNSREYTHNFEGALLPRSAAWRKCRNGVMLMLCYFDYITMPRLDESKGMKQHQ